MKLVVQVMIEPDNGDAGESIVVNVATIERGALSHDTLGLHLAEAKKVVAGIQEAMVAEQAARAVAATENCVRCGRRHGHKDSRTIVCRTLFGVVRVDSPGGFAVRAHRVTRSRSVRSQGCCGNVQRRSWCSSKRNSRG